MTTIDLLPARPDAQDRFGGAIAARLNGGAESLPYEITERLRAARTQALAHRKRVQSVLAPRVVPSGGAAALGFDEEGLSIWGRIASALPIVVLACGLVLLHGFQNDKRASELAEVDVQLLTDDLPPAAYADPGFLQFLKSAPGNDAKP